MLLFLLPLLFEKALCLGRLALSCRPPGWREIRGLHKPGLGNHYSEFCGCDVEKKTEKRQRVRTDVY